MLLVLLTVSIMMLIIAIYLIMKKQVLNINPGAVYCPRCGNRIPFIRKPANLRQALRGGGTCSVCGCELDRLGKSLDRR